METSNEESKQKREVSTCNKDKNCYNLSKNLRPEPESGDRCGINTSGRLEENGVGRCEEDDLFEDSQIETWKDKNGDDYRHYKDADKTPKTNFTIKFSERPHLNKNSQGVERSFYVDSFLYEKKLALERLKSDKIYKTSDEPSVSVYNELAEIENFLQGLTGFEVKVSLGEKVILPTEVDMSNNKEQNENSSEVVKNNEINEVNSKKDYEFDENLKKYVCKRCNKYFICLSSIKNHLRNVCNVEPKLTCPCCSYKTRTNISLKVHIARYHNALSFKNEQNKRIGNQMKKILNQKANLSNKVEINLKENTTEVQVDCVEMSSMEQDNGEDLSNADEKPVKLRGEEENQFDYDIDKDKFKCRSCKRTFRKKEAVIAHSRAPCRKPQIKCMYCPYTSKTPVSLRVHIGHKHGRWPRLSAEEVTKEKLSLLSNGSSDLTDVPDNSENMVQIVAIEYNREDGAEKQVEKVLQVSHNQPLTLALKNIFSVAPGVYESLAEGVVESGIQPDTYISIPIEQCPKVSLTYLKEITVEGSSKNIAASNDASSDETIGNVSLEEDKTQGAIDLEEEIEFDEISNQYKCKRCTFPFKKKESLKTHLKKCGLVTNDFSCHFCLYSAKKAVTLHVHLMRNHNLTASRARLLVENQVSNKSGKSKYKRTKREELTTKKESSSSVEETVKTVDVNLITESKPAFCPKSNKSSNPKRKKSSKCTQKKSDARKIHDPTLVMFSNASPSEVDTMMSSNNFEYDEEKKLFKCKFCNKNYKKKVTLESHYGKGMCKKTQHKCLYCPYFAPSASKVRMHIGHKHGHWPKLGENNVWIY